MDPTKVLREPQGSLDHALRKVIIKQYLFCQASCYIYIGKPSKILSPSLKIR